MLEGGYDLGALAGSMAALMPVLVGRVDAPIGGAVERHPLADEALAPADAAGRRSGASATGVAVLGPDRRGGRAPRRPRRHVPHVGALDLAA